MEGTPQPYLAREGLAYEAALAAMDLAVLYTTEGRGDDIPVSRLPIDGTWPSGTAMWEKRNIAS